MTFSPRGLAIAIVSTLAVVTTSGCDDFAESPLEPPVQGSQDQFDQASAELDWQEQLFAMFGELRSIHAQINECSLEICQQHTAGQYEAASQGVEAMAEKIQPRMKEISAKLQSLKQSLESQTPDNVENIELLASAEQQFADAQRRLGELQSVAVQLAQTAEDVKDLGLQDDALKRITLAGEAESAGQIDEAIEHYEAALQSWPDAANIRQRLDQLKQTWAVKSAEHGQARQFVYGTWIGAEPDELAALLPEAHAALQTLKQVDDYLSTRALLHATDKHLGRLTATPASPSGEAGQPLAAAPDKLTADIARFVLEISDYLAARHQPPGSFTEEPTGRPR